MPQEQIASLRASIEAWLSENGLLPETAVFTLQGGSILRWDIDMLPMEKQAADFMAGTVMVEIDADGNIATFYCSMVKYEYAGILGVVSASEAYKQIMDGNFKQYSPLKNGDVLTLTGYSLGYELDTKGYYRPVYRFAGYINDTENVWEGVVSAE